MLTWLVVVLCSVIFATHSAYETEYLDVKRWVNDERQMFKYAVYHKVVFQILELEPSNFSTTPTVANFSPSSIAGEWFLSYSRNLFYEAISLNDDPTDERWSFSVDDVAPNTLKVADCSIVEAEKEIKMHGFTVFRQKNILRKSTRLSSSSRVLDFCEQYDIQLSEMDGVLYHPMRATKPLLKLLVPYYRYGGVQIRIIDVNAEYFVWEYCVIFNGKCPQQGLSIGVFTKRKILSAAALKRLKAVVNSATTFKFEDLDVVDQSEDYPFQSDVDRLVVRY